MNQIGLERSVRWSCSLGDQAGNGAKVGLSKKLKVKIMLTNYKMVSWVLSLGGRSDDRD